ncbi:MAG TPA: hypothetical protein VLJ10_03960 [Candidatus Bathyarchaeia archaeon]|nr:hypothetical protein [Candidatus Bathyarchaeia archaeon]
MDEYYSSTGKVVKDIFLGGGIVILGVVVWAFAAAYANMISYQWYVVFGNSTLLLGLIALIFISRRYHKKGRKFIWIGIVLALILPLLSFGACFAIMMGTY